MKKLLAMVLALVMTLSLAVSANAFKDDKSISDDYAEAVAVLNCDATNVNRPQHWRSYHYQGQDRYHCWLHQHGCCQH